MIEIIKANAAEINIDPKEVAVYLGYYSVKSTDNNTKELICSCTEEFLDAAEFRACIAKVPVKTDNGVDLGFMKTESRSLQKNLFGCEYAYVLAATTGFAAHRLIQKKSLLSPLFGIVTDCIGSTAIEAFCDKINLSLENSDFLRPRFSPGYGDLSIEFQKNIVNFLETKKNIGLSLNDSMIMTPIKSVTAIIGIGNEKNRCTGPGCMICRNSECPYR